MKKLSILFSLLLLCTISFSSVGVKTPGKKAAEIMLPLGNNKTISLQDLSTISVNDFEKLSGKNLKFIDRLGFKAGQKKLKKSINVDGTLNNKRLIKMLGNGDPTTGFHVGGFLLGFLVGLIGVLIAYVIGGDQDIKRNRTKWAWIGFGIYVVILLVILAAVGPLN